MENAASTVATFSPPMPPFQTEFYNNIHPSIFDIQRVHSYSMQEIVSKLRVPLNEVHGATTLNLIGKILEQKIGFQMSPSMSVQDLHKFMPIVNFVKEDMKPDLCILHAVLFAEEDSHQCNHADRCITKACIYANFLCRYLATHNLRSPGYCIHFPSAHLKAEDSKSFAAIIRCTWSYENFCFLYSAEPLDLNTLEQSITALLDELNALQFHDRDRATLYHLLKLDFNQVNHTTFFTERGWTCNSQCLS